MSDTVNTAGDALRRLDESLSATNVLSKDYRNHVLGWAQKAVELAYDAGLEKGRAEGRAKRVPAHRRPRPRPVP